MLRAHPGRGLVHPSSTKQRLDMTFGPDCRHRKSGRGEKALTCSGVEANSGPPYDDVEMQPASQSSNSHCQGNISQTMASQTVALDHGSWLPMDAAWFPHHFLLLRPSAALSPTVSPTEPSAIISLKVGDDEPAAPAGFPPNPNPDWAWLWDIPSKP